MKYSTPFQNGKDIQQVMQHPDNIPLVQADDIERYEKSFPLDRPAVILEIAKLAIDRAELPQPYDKGVLYAVMTQARNQILAVRLPVVPL